MFYPQSGTQIKVNHSYSSDLSDHPSKIIGATKNNSWKN